MMIDARLNIASRLGFVDCNVSGSTDSKVISGMYVNNVMDGI